MDIYTTDPQPGRLVYDPLAVYSLRTDYIWLMLYVGHTIPFQINKYVFDNKKHTLNIFSNLLYLQKIVETR